MVKASQRPDETEFIETHSEEGDGQRKWTVVHHAEEIQRYDNIKRVYVRPAGRTGGLFSHHRGMGAVCCAACTSVFTPFVSFILPHSTFFSGIFSFWSSKTRFFSFFFLCNECNTNFFYSSVVPVNT